MCPHCVQIEKIPSSFLLRIYFHQFWFGGALQLCGFIGVVALIVIAGIHALHIHDTIMDLIRQGAP
jgi:hypothetical protein